AGWIYERIHYDQTPIDIMFIGTSRSVFGVNSAGVESAYRQATRQSLHVVNFAMQHLGRDLHYLLAQEALLNRTIKLLVLEITEDEPRDLHPAFGPLADVSDILLAPLIINVSYFANLGRLPLRQMQLFLRTTFPGVYGTTLEFTPAKYRGARWDDTYAATGSFDHPIHPVVPRLQSHTETELEQQRLQSALAIARKLALPPAFHQLERRANLSYVQGIAELARKQGVEIRFLMMPQHLAAAPAFSAFYQQYGPIWSPGPAIIDAKLWTDINHLNHAGAMVLAPWLAGRMTSLIPNKP
ncbi:MAG: hypothetical protein H7251_14735, partial [Acetobacteraceae bacterium]|nr:hypothetical protein [Acetobacteraceae bacterium]